MLPDDINLAESVINEINGVDMDCVLSVLPAQKEALLSRVAARFWMRGFGSAEDLFFCRRVKAQSIGESTAVPTETDFPVSC